MCWVRLVLCSSGKVLGETPWEAVAFSEGSRKLSELVIKWVDLVTVVLLGCGGGAFLECTKLRVLVFPLNT